jgi:hypothetical protein
LAGIDITKLGESGYLANYDSGWRLPTMEENRMFIGIGSDEDDDIKGNGSVYYQWSSGTGIFPANTAREEDPQLPAAGCRYKDNGGTASQDYGLYWASNAVSNVIINGQALAFVSDRVHPSTYYEDTFGFTVRCIRD